VTPGDIYNPNGLNAHALQIASGGRKGTFLRHANFVVHGDAWAGNNFDFSWVFDTYMDGSYAISNYYGGGGWHLDFNGANVLIKAGGACLWAAVP